MPKKKRKIAISSDFKKALKWLNAIGIKTVETDWTADGFFKGVHLWDGTLVYNPERVHLGDLMHEAGHLAITPAKLRPLLGIRLERSYGFEEVAQAEYRKNDDSPEFQAFINVGEDAAIAWSYCAAKNMELDPAILFEQGFPRDTGKIHLQQLNQSVGCSIPCHAGVYMLYHAGFLFETEFFPHLNFWLQAL